MSRNSSANAGLAALVAVLAYLPFELVAKGTLILCAGIFVFDPFPLSRIVALAAVGVVGCLARLEKNGEETVAAAPAARETPKMFGDTSVPPSRPSTSVDKNSRKEE
mmetsp:Transcript_32333/g.96931  ORF Transcript_32333/g.96931 Transcript_32333/m.96931 type:complete len:107 (+) Transcript_32333:126-446(+)